MINQRLLYSFVFYLLLITLVLVSKPKPLFNDAGDIAKFGVGEDKTIFSLGVFVVCLSLMSFYFVTLIDIIFQV